MESDVILNVKGRGIKKTKTKRLFYVSAIVIVLSIVALNLISFLIT